MPKVTEGTFLEHLDEMRRRLWVAVLSFLISSVAAFYYSDRLLQAALFPMQAEVQTLYFFTPADMFIAKMQMALLAGFFIASPVIFGQFWFFVSPAMHPHEKRVILPWIFITSALFLGGVAFAYFQVIPVTLHFLLSMQNEWIKPLLSVNQYLSFLGMMLVAFGAAFNLPIFILGLVSVGVLNVQVLNQFQRQIIVLIFLVAAILTPGPDIASQLLLALPLLVLFELGVLMAVVLDRLRKRSKSKVTVS